MNGRVVVPVRLDVIASFRHHFSELAGSPVAWLFVVLVAPDGVGFRQRADTAAPCDVLLCAFDEERSELVAFLSVVPCRLHDLWRWLEADVSAFEESTDCPVENASRLGFKVREDFMAFAPFVLRDRDGERDHVDAPPYSLVGALDIRLVVSHEPKLMSGKKGVGLFKWPAGIDGIASGDRLHLAIGQFPPLGDFVCEDNPLALHGCLVIIEVVIRLGSEERGNRNRGH